MKRFGLVFLFVLVLAGAVCSAADKKTAQINCDIQKHSCTLNLAGSDVIFNISPRPVKAMADLTFQVKLADPQPAKPPYIDLGMPGMKMGPNHVDLKAVRPGTYEGRGIIVRCPSGRTVWRATVTVPGRGAVDFIFDVVY